MCIIVVVLLDLLMYIRHGNLRCGARLMSIVTLAVMISYKLVAFVSIKIRYFIVPR